MDDEEKKAYLYEIKINKKKINMGMLEDLKIKGKTIPDLRDFEVITGVAYIGDEDVIIE